VNELVTNSFKYAFKELESGEINLLIGKGNDNNYQLDIRDNGPGFPAGELPKSSKSLGLKLVTLFTEQLNGSMQYQNDKGSHFRFTFQLISLA
jgi:two-component sensor histidine kinase